MTTIDYDEFVIKKHVEAEDSGVEVGRGQLPKKLFPWQKKVVQWALRKGRAALFLDTGFGKSFCQLAWADQVVKHTGLPVLIICPLAVGPQTVKEAVKFGIDGVEQWKEGSSARIQVVNYHKLHLIDTSVYSGVVIDESSILKSFMGKVKRTLCESFANTKFRLACTATPAPNDHMELGNHSAFLGVMDSDEMLTRWFINDLSQAGVYRLKKHAEDDYWRWVASWACCVSKPSDIGGDDTGYNLPELKILHHTVEETIESKNGVLFDAAQLTATGLHRQKRKTAADRAAKVAELVNAEIHEPWIVWCDTDYEAEELMKVLPKGTIEVAGSMSDSAKEDGLMGFTEGRYKIIVSKPGLAGFGLNWQHCARVAFIGLSFSWEQFYQAVRRAWRFGQTREVMVHVVTAESEQAVVDTNRRKQAENDRMRIAMTKAASKHWNEDSKRKLVTNKGSISMRHPKWLVSINNTHAE